MDKYDKTAQELFDYAIKPETLASWLREAAAEALDQVAKRAEALNQERAGRPGGWIAMVIRDDVGRYAAALRSGQKREGV